VADSPTVEPKFSPAVANIVDAVKCREKHDRIIRFEKRRVQLVVCLLNKDYYAFYGDAVQEIVAVPVVTHVPGMPAYLLGVIHVRGEIESVLDVRQILGLPAAFITTQSRIALGQVGELRTGLLIDAVEDVLEVPEDDIHVPASEIDAAKATFVLGEMLYHEHHLIVLDLHKIFDAILSSAPVPAGSSTVGEER